MSTCNEEKGRDVMVSNLPLLFSNGNPTSIQSLSVEDLQYFIPFLLKCILGCEPSGWAKHPRFKWWPSGVPWSSIILSKKHQTPLWEAKLQQLVRQCYEYNGCTYLLQFSARLQALIGSFKYTDNWDGTTSMFDSKSGKLLVTFRNENMNYDKGFRQQATNNRPMLLPRLNSPSTPVKSMVGSSNPSIGSEAPSSAQMVEPLPICDIYLCDYCGAEFSTLLSIKAHEGKCMAEKALQSQSSINQIELETNDLDQAKFMWYLNLSCRNHTARPPNVTPAKILPTVKKNCTLSDKRFTTIPFSSNLGQRFFKSSRFAPVNSEILVIRYDRSCVARTVGNNPLHVLESNYQSAAGSSRTLRPFAQKRRDESVWTHSYCFNKAQRRERMLTINTGLNRRARQLLTVCKGARLKLRRLTRREIEMWTRPKPKLIQPLLQPWVQRSIAHLHPDCTISLAPATSSGVLFSPKQGASPALSVSRPESAKQFVKVKPKPPPALVPLITSTWSLQGAKTKSSFSIPSQKPHSVPVAKKLPTTIQPRSTITSSRSLPINSSSNEKIFIDLCSSDDEEPTEEEKAVVGAMFSRPFFLPNGITITKVERKPSGVSLPSISRNLPHSEHNNNRPRNGGSQTLVESASTLRSSPPVLKFMGHHNRVVETKEENSAAATPVPARSLKPLHSIAPIKLGGLPVEKREQMKQSLLKIQKEEGKTPPSSSEKEMDSSKGQLPTSHNRLPHYFPGNELNRNGHFGSSILSEEGKFGRKRPNESCCLGNDEHNSPRDPNRKTPKLDDPARRRERTGNFSTIIEVDVAYQDRENRGDSPTSSFGSITPNSRSKRSCELSRLLEDECKELKQMGLQEMPFHEQRVTRCRTKSLPMMASKRV